MSVNIRVMGPQDEVDKVVEALISAPSNGVHIEVQSVSDPYPCRGRSVEVRVYVHASVTDQR